MAPKLDASFALRSALRLAPSFQVLRSGFVGAATISAVLNILALTGSFFMLLVYDRAIPAHSSATLTGLVCLAVLLYGFQAALEVLRSRIFIRLGGAVNVALAEDVFASIVRTGRLAARPSDALQPVRDLDQVRAFLSGGGPAALMDLPWMALYLAICFALHAVIGLTALVGAILLIALTALTETLSRPATGRIAQLASERNGALVAAQHNADIVLAHGMLGRLSRLWFATESRYLAAQQEAADVTGGLSSLTRVLRLLLQSLVLAAGAYLVIRERASAGMIIAGSILASRALAPVELAISNWRGLAAARQSWARLGALLANSPAAGERLALPAPSLSLEVEAVTVGPPGRAIPTLSDVSFAIRAGEALGVIGPSGGGKSTLARALVGVWPLTKGQVRLDASPLPLWPADSLGPHIGYLPQEVQLIAGSIARNIARFEETPAPERVIAAARAAGVHELIMSLSEGYETQVGEDGQALSAGQRQRIALARALYADPFLIVLDEPNSNLDADGEAALSEAIQAVRNRGGVVVVIAHRPSALSATNKILVIRDGRAVSFGPKEEILAGLLPPSAGLGAGLGAGTGGALR